MSEQIEYEAADQIRCLMDEDERFKAVSGATAFRHADLKRGWQDAGYFSFDRHGHRYFVTVERADAPALQQPGPGGEVERLREWVCNLLNKLNPQDFYVFERIENSILDNESDPNPEAADSERDHWLINQTWIASLVTVVDLIDAQAPTAPEPERREDGERLVQEVAHTCGDPTCLDRAHLTVRPREVAP